MNDEQRQTHGIESLEYQGKHKFVAGRKRAILSGGGRFYRRLFRPRYRVLDTNTLACLGEEARTFRQCQAPCMCKPRTKRPDFPFPPHFELLMLPYKAPAEPTSELLPSIALQFTVSPEKRKAESLMSGLRFYRTKNALQ
jgi:hypothetical protein